MSETEREALYAVMDILIGLSQKHPPIISPEDGEKLQRLKLYVSAIDV